MDELTIAFKIESPPSWLPIGRTAENNWRTVEIDCSYWFNMNANGEVVLMYKPSCGMSPYPLLTERDGDNIIWRPKSGELVEGVGRLQAFFEVGTDVIGSSGMISCEVDSSLLGVEPGTDPGQTDLPWALDIIAQIAELSGHYPKIIDGNLYIWDSTLNDWVEFEAGGGGAVDSVNGKTGAVVLDASDVGALPDDTVIPSQIGQLSDNVGLVHYNSQTLTDVQKAQARTNVGAGTYSKPSGGIPASDLASGVIPAVPQMATAADMSDWDSGKTVDAATLKADYMTTVLVIDDLSVNKANKSEIPTKTSDLTNNSGFQTAAQVQTTVNTAISNIPDELPAVNASDNGKVLGVVNGAWAVKSDEGGSTITVDSALSDTSENPVQNKVVKAALDTKADASALAAKQDTLTAGQNVTISGNTISADVDSAEIASNVTNWLNTNVNPVGSAVVVDSSLSVSGAAADAKATGDITNRIAEDIDLNSGGNQNMMPAIKPGFYSASDGAYNGTRRDYVCSAELFPVQEGDELSLIGEVKYTGWYLNKWDASGNYVSSQSYAKAITSVTIPSGVGLVGLSFNFGSAADRTIDDVPAVYINYNPYAQPHRTVAERLEALESSQDLIGYGYSPIHFTAAAGWRGSQNNYYNTAGHYHVDISVTEGEKYHVKTRTNNAEIKGASWFPSDFGLGTEALAGNASDDIDGYLTVPSGAAYLTVNCAHAYSVVIEKYGLLSEAETGLQTYFQTEVDDTVTKVKNFCGEKALVLAAVTDSHLNANYGYQVWNDTVKNMLAVNEEYQLDGVLHLGDMINGDNTATIGKEQLDLIRNGFRASYPDAAYFDGNHDTNTFYGESMDDPITEAQMYSEMFRFNARDIVRPDGKLYGYKDYDALGIRVVYLHSSMGDGTHGGQGTNWGYPQDELTWVQNVALDTNYQVLLLSHMPVTEGYISNSATLPNNGNALKTIINSFIDNGGVVIGLFHGHTHWDDVEDNGKFKEVSICCEAYNYIPNELVGTAIHSYTPASAVRPARMRYTLTQDLWDVVIVRPASRTVKLVRFGAGVDRAFSY